MSKLYIFFILLFNLQCALSLDDINKALENDNEIYWRKRFVQKLEKGDHLSINVDLSSFSGKILTLLSRVIKGNEVSSYDLSDEECKKYLSAYKTLLSLSTSKENIIKILEREELVSSWRKNGEKSDEEIDGWIHWFEKQGEWGPIINKESQAEAQLVIQSIIDKNANNFLLRHTLEVGEMGLSGKIVIYPGHNVNILEDNFYNNLDTPQGHIADLHYQISYSVKRLNINNLSVNPVWQSKGHGYAISQYLTLFAREHFGSIISILTVSCRNPYSEKIFEKCGFSKKTSFKSHYKENQDRNFRDNKIMKAWGQSNEDGYKRWLNANYPKIFPDEYFKVGFKFFL